MFAVDTCSLIAFEEGLSGRDVELVRSALIEYRIILPPVVVNEMVSNPSMSPLMRKLISDLKMLETKEHYWIRAGELRAQLRRQKFKCKLGDALIAQSCIDHGVPLITRDKDFRHFAKHGGLQLAV
jgi:predicted nucleic acid-binding protein